MDERRGILAPVTRQELHYYVPCVAGGQMAADLAANKITYARTPPASPFAEWQAIHFGAAAPPLVDPDGDALPNAVEYALALDPLAPSAWPAGSLVAAGGRQHLAITFTRASMATDATITVEVSGDLATWTPGELGLQHGLGARAAPWLADHGCPVPDEWYVAVDNPKRGLVVKTYQAPAKETLTWLVRASDLACPLDAVLPWQAVVRSRT